MALAADTTGFRDYAAEARASVQAFYREHHAKQTLAFARQKQAEYGGLTHRRMGVWQAVEYLDQLVDDSDPDLDQSQIVHALQTAEAIRADGGERWFQLTGFIHDLGKVLCLFGEPQWAVVGDTYPVGCAWADSIVYREFLDANPDRDDPLLQSPNGIYQPGCGLEALEMSWGHDEYLYHVVRPYLPMEGLAMIRYHSCYPIHREGAYHHLLRPADQRLLDQVRRFNAYDLYTKSPVAPDWTKLKPYYQDLVAEFLPDTLDW
ncbi:MAG: inositol oxygenase [Alphaproteobacteria bacterium]|nr:MAG: inositol oxygenase [Alphaproteobacteria bacterium]